MPVTREEVGKGLSYREPSETASPLDTYYTVGGDMVCMKIPKVIADRRYAAAKRLCDEAVATTEPKSPLTDRQGLQQDPESPITHQVITPKSLSQKA